MCLAAHPWDEHGSEDGLRCFQGVTEISVPPGGIKPELPPLPAACQPSWWTTHHERLAKAPCGGMLGLASLLCPMAGCWTLSHQHLKGMWPHAFSILVLSFLFHFVFKDSSGETYQQQKTAPKPSGKGLGLEPPKDLLPANPSSLLGHTFSFPRAGTAKHESLPTAPQLTPSGCCYVSAGSYAP